jgi:hypothetical protein
MRPLLASCLTIGLTAAAASAGPLPDQVLFEQGRQAVLELRWSDATAALTRLLEAYPDSSYSDGARYWRAFARAEAGDCASAYSDLIALEERFPSSPRLPAARALRVRCAGALLASSSQGVERAKYARVISDASQHSTLPARLSAADVLLSADPAEGARALREATAGLDDPTLAEVILDRHFGDALALARPADPSLPMGPANAVILVRTGNGMEALGVPEALRAAGDDSASGFPTHVRIAVEEALLAVRRAGARPGAAAGREASRVAQVEDTEIHLYRGGLETVRIVVLSRRNGYRDDNVRVFVERDGRIVELSAREAEQMVRESDTRAMGQRALTFVGSSLALIRLDLGAAAAAPTGSAR